MQAWRGQPFSANELQGFNLLNILNKPCQLQIIKEEKNGNTYNNISSIMALPKGMTIELLNETSHFDIEDVETWINWSKIPNWIQDKIKKADNYQESGLDKYVSEYEETVKEQEGKQAENYEYKEVVIWKKFGKIYKIIKVIKLATKEEYEHITK